MRIIRYYDNAADIIYQGPHYTALYRMILELYTKGRHPGAQFLEAQFPSVTLVNCSKTIVEETAGFDDIRPYLDDFHKKLSPRPKFKNPPVETLGRKTYECHPCTAEQRMAVMAAACYLGCELKTYKEEQAAQFKEWLKANDKEYTFVDTYLSAIPTEQELHAPQSPSQAEILEDYCLSKFVVDSVDRILPTKDRRGKIAFMEEVTESFLGDRECLHRILSGILTCRFDILEAEMKADEAPGEAGTPQSIPSGEPVATKQATTRQLGILFYYLFNELGIDFTNSDKSAWARLLSFITGYSEDTLRKKLDFDFEAKQVQKDMGVVKAAVEELFPAIARKIEKDKKI